MESSVVVRNMYVVIQTAIIGYCDTFGEWQIVTIFPHFHVKEIRTTNQSVPQ